MSIHKLPPNKAGAQRWKVVVYVGAGRQGGRQLTKVVTGTRSDAVKVEATLIDQAEKMPRRPDVMGGPMTMDDLMARWIAHNESRWCARRPVEEAARWRDYGSPTLGRKQIDKLTQMDLDALYAALGKTITKRNTKLSARSIELVHSQISAALGQAEKWGLIARNPARLASPPRPTPKSLELPPIEALTLAIETLRAEGDFEHALLMELAATLGRRRAETLALRWSDFDFEAGSVEIKRALVYDPASGWFEARTTKSRSSSVVPVLPFLAESLKEHRERQIALYQRLGITPKRDDLLFIKISNDLQPVFHRPVYLTIWWGKNRDRLGLGDMRWHDIRHWAASRLIRTGADIQTVKEWLGHKSTATTMRYAHLFTEIRQDLAHGAFSEFDRKPPTDA